VVATLDHVYITSAERIPKLLPRCSANQGRASDNFVQILYRFSVVITGCGWKRCLNVYLMLRTTSFNSLHINRCVSQICHILALLRSHVEMWSILAWRKHPITSRIASSSPADGLSRLDMIHVCFRCVLRVSRAISCFPFRMLSILASLSPACMFAISSRVSSSAGRQHICTFCLCPTS